MGVLILIDVRLLDLETNYCRIRPLERADVPLVYRLRRESRDQYLNPILEDISHQYEYYESYLSRYESGDEIYYVIHDLKLGEDVGVVRLTDIQEGPRYNWHSLIVLRNASPQIGIDICVMFYAIGFDILGKETCGPWPVKKSFTKMVRLHEYMKMAKIVEEDQEYYYYQVEAPDYQAISPALRRASFGVVKGVHGGE